jgi:hypothetical protein
MSLTVAALLHRTPFRPQKPTFQPRSPEVCRGIKDMIGLPVRNIKRLFAFPALIVLALVTAVFSLRGYSPESARDFEECVEAITANQSRSTDERRAAMTGCNAGFAGRRKPGGGYSYFDFMQGRNFDIAGPNPTAEERKLIDREYIAFLDAQRQEAASAELARKKDEQLRSDLEIRRQPVAAPLVLTPKFRSPPAAKRQNDRSKSTPCEDNSLACGWLKLSAAVRDAFASSAITRP